MIKINDKVKVINNPLPKTIKKNEWVVSKVIKLRSDITNKLRTTIVIVDENGLGNYAFNEKDIVKGLKSGVITGYGTDVIEDEFGDLTKSPIIKAMNDGKNIIVTPHVGGMTIEGQTKAYEWSINKL